VRFPDRGGVRGIYAALIAILIGVIVAAGLGTLNAQWVAAASAAVPILIALLASAQNEASRPLPEKTASEFAEDLAPLVLENWKAELPARGLDPGRLMPLRLVNAGAEGTLDEMVEQIGQDIVRGRPPRLVITGEMGAGKTASCVLLVIELAERHRLLPVLFELAGWDPEIPLRAWLADQLPEIFPSVGRARNDRKVAATMVDRHILPVLDGLDEIPDPATALHAIDGQMAGRPFVLTCRRAEFASASAAGPLHQVQVAELQPMRPDEVRSVLLDYEPATVGGPLTPVTQTLLNEPAGPVAEALSTPFMVSLARDTGAKLADLPDTAEDIREYLLGTFVQMAYPDPARARRYLRFLARHTDGAGRLAWWRLHLAVPRAMFLAAALAIAVPACSGLAAAFFILFDRVWLGFWIGLVAGIVGSFVTQLIPQEDPKRARPRFRSVRVATMWELAGTLGYGLIGAAVVAVMAGFLFGPLQYAVIGGALSGLTYAAARYVRRPNDPLRAVTPDSLLRADRTTVVFSGLAAAIPGAVTGAYLGYSFRAGHRTSLGTLAVLHHSSPVIAAYCAVAGCVLSGAGLGLLAMGSSAWGGLQWTRIWLAARGDTPLRLMTFLDDAYRRGILRQVNGYYEFRHQMLWRYLKR
jgi:hypothetical protein